MADASWINPARACTAVGLVADVLRRVEDAVRERAVELVERRPDRRPGGSRASQRAQVSPTSSSCGMWSAGSASRPWLPDTRRRRAARAWPPLPADRAAILLLVGVVGVWDRPAGFQSSASDAMWLRRARVRDQPKHGVVGEVDLGGPIGGRHRGVELGFVELARRSSMRSSEAITACSTARHPASRGARSSSSDRGTTPWRPCWCEGDFLVRKAVARRIPPDARSEGCSVIRAEATPGEGPRLGAAADARRRLAG